jgi:uncharacterized protein (DUF58 family)
MLLTLADGLIAAAPTRLAVEIDAPGSAAIAAGGLDAGVALSWRGGAPRVVDVALECNSIVSAPVALQRAPVSGNRARLDIKLGLLRRGEAVIEAAHCRWAGPLGLANRSAVKSADRRIAVTPDLGAVEANAERLFSRTMLHGLKPMRDRGDGSEFDSLTDFHQGMDRRLVEWKQSARHARLLAKEVRVERNHQIALAIDTGRAMCEPVEGAPRLDWSVNAALVLGYVALKLGDRVSCFGFDARPRVSTGFVSGTREFGQLLSQTARLEYSTEESNYTLGLTRLAERLRRRSLIVVFTEFTDSISAELLLENIGRLVRRHVILFVTFPDAELEQMRSAAPERAEDVARAVAAHRLLQERQIVLERLRRMGVHIVAAALHQLGPALVAAYDHIRRRERL